jgi:hypothetical protein
MAKTTRNTSDHSGPKPPPRIEYLRVQNYRALQDVELKNITPLMALLGPNGSGKSTVFDVFNFLFECFQYGLRHAWNRRGRARELKTRGQDGPIVIKFKYREQPSTPVITSQLLVTTHSPFFLNGMKPDEVRVIYRNEDGYSEVQRASEVPGIPEFVKAGVSMGHLWIRDYPKKVLAATDEPPAPVGIPCSTAASDSCASHRKPWEKGGYPGTGFSWRGA